MCVHSLTSTLGPLAKILPQSCLDILNYYPGALSLAAFHAANPSVDSKCFNLQPGTAVCVSGPVNVAPGSFTLDNGCTKFRKVNKGDTCESIVKSIGDITLADFYRFNSKVDIKCSNVRRSVFRRGLGE